MIVSSDGEDWEASGLSGEPFEHVSVSTARRCPRWEEMEFVRRQFFEDDECVMQLHVPESDHINTHNFCLHLWRPVKTPIPRPPAVCV